MLSFCLPPTGTGSATPITIDFGAILSFTDVPAYNLPIYASQWPLPVTTQDLVRGCELGFTAAPISGDWITRAFKAQPAQIRTCAFTHTALLKDEWRESEPVTETCFMAHRSNAGTCSFLLRVRSMCVERCSPPAAPFPPRPPQEVAFPCSVGSQVSGRRWRTELTRCWPPSAAQTVHAVFPHTAFTKTRQLENARKVLARPDSPAHTHCRA